MNDTLDVLILRLDAPLMSFGAPVVDQQGKIQAFPAQSLVTGLLANALGFNRSEHERLTDLQRRLRYAVRQDRAGQKITDYQTVDLTPAHMSSYVWTKSGRKRRRTDKPREILHRDYWADAIYTIALTLDPAGENPALDDLADAVQQPARPLFVGRKTCLPSAPLYAGRTRAGGLREVLMDAAKAPLAERAQDSGPYPAWWPVHPDDEAPSEGAVKENIRKPVTDRRDWENQIHVGERWIARGDIEVTNHETS